MSSARALALVASLALFFHRGCVGEPTQIIAVVDTDLCVPSDINLLLVEVNGEVVVRRPLTGSDAPEWPASLTLVRTTDLPSARVVVTGLNGTAEVIRRSAVASFVSGRALALDVGLWRACLGIGCGEGLTCVEPGDCVSETQSGLSDFVAVGDPRERECPDACDDRIGCTRDEVIGGACEHAPDDAACGAGGRCDPATDCQFDVCTPENCARRPGSCETVSCVGSLCDRRSSCGVGVSCCDGSCCDDGNPCTRDDCVAGSCVSRMPAREILECQAWTCDSETGVVGRVEVPGACDDGDPCTVDTCTVDGACQHAQAPDDTYCAANAMEQCDTRAMCRGGVCIEYGPCTSTQQCCPRGPSFGRCLARSEICPP